MIRHAYTQCTPCHVDLSGSGPLSAYGRAIADEVVRTRWPGEKTPGGDTAPSAGFLWGALTLPEALILQGDVRYLHIEQKVEGAPALNQNIWMQADFAAALQLDRFTALATLGYADQGALAAALTRAPQHNLVSRQHWIGYSLLDGNLMLRGGRMNVPFGLRVIEHTLWARALTRTSIDADQQYGLSATYFQDRFRAELMAVLGNFELRPDAYRERGYTGYFEYYPLPKLGLGASSLVTYRRLDPITQKQTFRQVHGIFGRFATPWDPLVVMTEWDYTFESPKYAPRTKGVVGFVQADLEALSGIHLIGTFEAQNVGTSGAPFSWGAWLSYAWFFAPHADVRLDSLYQSIGVPSGSIGAISLLLQGHVFL